MKSKKIKLPNWLSSTILLMLTFIQGKIEDFIKDPVIVTGVRTLFTPIKATIQVLSDENEQNAQQLRNVWLAYINHDLNQYLLQVSQNVIEDLKNPKYNNILNRLVPTTLGMLSDVTDTNPNNKDQIKKRWSDLMLDDTFQDLVMADMLDSWIDKKVTDADAAALIKLQLGQWVDYADDKFEGIAENNTEEIAPWDKK